MFNIGFGELAIICIVLIIAVGPERLPSMMKTLGKTLRTLRQASRDIRASTGIDELLREDFDLYAPPPPRRPAPIPQAPVPVPVIDVTPPSLPSGQDSARDSAQDAAPPAEEPKPVSREDVIAPAPAPAPVVHELKPLSREDIIGGVDMPHVSPGIAGDPSATEPLLGRVSSVQPIAAQPLGRESLVEVASVEPAQRDSVIISAPPRLIGGPTPPSAPPRPISREEVIEPASAPAAPEPSPTEGASSSDPKARD
jgi:sec-independent protein translocase protein TatB